MFSSDDLSSLRLASDGHVEIIDQTLLPHELRWVRLEGLAAYCHAIEAMQVRGAPLIGITAAFGLAHALALDASDTNCRDAAAQLLATRPTAVNLRWALEQVTNAVEAVEPASRAATARVVAETLRAEDIRHCASIGEHGLELFRELPPPKGRPLNIMTHCNAGWLATIQWGTALAPIYKAHEAGIAVHVWVSETRPRNQGMNLTAWELERAGVPCTVVADNSCGYLLQTGAVDCIIVGSDRTAANGDVCNKIGTYLKALAAQDNGVPFYVALPESTVDWDCPGGADIPIEERSADEVLQMAGMDSDGQYRRLRIASADTRAANPAFDVTPHRLVSALITEFGVFAASTAGLNDLRREVAGR